jgi:hypothetical protein
MIDLFHSFPGNNNFSIVHFRVTMIILFPLSSVTCHRVTVSRSHRDSFPERPRVRDSTHHFCLILCVTALHL